MAILDYKTGQVERPRRWFDERPRASQLGLYTLAQRAAQPTLAVRAVAYAELRAEGAAAVGVAADEHAWPGLESAAAAIQRAVEALRAGYPPDVIAVDIMAALDHLGELVGRTSPEAVLDRVFSEFCIGK